jgi:hypothetical protein
MRPARRRKRFQRVEIFIGLFLSSINFHSKIANRQTSMFNSYFPSALP